LDWRVKHLNPRQGITTGLLYSVDAPKILPSVKHLNPRQGITTPSPLRQGLGTRITCV